MARYKGDGSDPLGQVVEGTVVDVPEGSPAEEHYSQFGKKVHPPGDVSDHRRRVEIAQAKVRGDALTREEEAKLADEIDGDEHAIVHHQNPKAKGTGQSHDKHGIGDDQKVAAGQASVRDTAKGDQRS